MTFQPSSPRSVAATSSSHKNDTNNTKPVVEEELSSIFTSGVSRSRSNSTTNHKKTIYFVRHAEAIHNVLEKQAVQEAIKNNQCKETARKSILLHNLTLKDAPLSDGGLKEVRQSCEDFQKLLQLSGSSSNLSLLDEEGSPPDEDDSSDDNYIEGVQDGRERALSHSSQDSTRIKQYHSPEIVLVSPLRRALMTATKLFLPDDDEDGVTNTKKKRRRPKFIALEILREKRTGMACDERSPVRLLRDKFPHVDFTDVEIDEESKDFTISKNATAYVVKKQKSYPIPSKGEQNPDVRKRANVFLNDILPNVDSQYLAIVSHKGWLRELRKTIKEEQEQSQEGDAGNKDQEQKGQDNGDSSTINNGVIDIDFDIDEWHQTLYRNAEIRVAEFEWKENNMLKSIVSRSVDNAIEEIVNNNNLISRSNPPSPQMKPLIGGGLRRCK